MQTQTPLTRCRHDVTGAIAPLPKRGWRLASNPPGRGRFSALRSLSPALQRRATQRAGARHPTRRSEGASAPFVRSARRFSAGRHSGQAPGIQPAGARALQRRAAQRAGAPGIQPAGARTLQRPSFAQPGASAPGDTADGRPASNPPERGRFSAGRRSGTAGARALQRRATQRDRPDFELGAGMMCETKPCTVHVRTSCGMVKAHGGAC